MTNLSHDASGFLSGPKVSADLNKIGRDIELLKAIREDTKSTVHQLGVIAGALTQDKSLKAQEPATPTVRPAADVPGAIARAVREGLAIAATPGTGESKPERAVSARPSGDKPVRVPARPVDAVPETRAQRTAATVAKPVDADEAVAAKRRKRAANGRFGSEESAAPGASGDDGESRTAKAMSAASESLRGAVDGLSSSADNIDPTVQAVKELGGIFAPVVNTIKPLGRLFGMGRRAPEDKRQRQNVQWYRRIVGAIKGNGGKSGGFGLIGTAILSMLGLLLAPLKALGRMLGAMRAIAAIGGLLKGLGGLAGLGRGRRGVKGGAGARSARNASTAPGRKGTRYRGGPAVPDARGRGGKPVSGRGAPAEARGGPRPTAGVGPKAEPRGGRDNSAKASSRIPPREPTGAGGLKGMSKGLLRKLPFIGALFAAGTIAGSVMASDAPGASPEEAQANKVDRWGGVGGGVGSLVGGALGMFGGPAGAIAGGMAGDMIGQKVGEWLATVDLSSLVKVVSTAFTGLADTAGKAASAAFDYLKEGWAGLISIGSKALSGLADWAKGKWDTAVEAVEVAKEYVGEKVATVKDSGQNLLNKATGGRYTGGSNAARDEMIKAMDEGGITDQKSKAMLMANADHESGGFTKTEENLNYSAERLQQVFPKYYKTAEAAQKDARNPEAIANRVYGGRMGNKDPGDGYKYRGRGSLQLTGRDQYEKMGKELGVDLVNNPDLAMDPKISAQIAVKHWKASGADRAATAGDVTRARKLTNGGTNGLEDVKKKYEEKYLAQAQAGDLTPARRGDDVRVAAPAVAKGAISSTMAAVKGASATPAVAGAPGVAHGPTPIASAGGTGAVGTKSADVSGAPAAGKQPIGIMAMPSAAATAPAPASVGVGPLAPVPAGGSIKVATAAPASIPALPSTSYSAPAPDASMAKIPSTPAVTKPSMAPSKDKGTPATMAPMPLTQNIEDRQIAHASTGGVGMSHARL